MYESIERGRRAPEDLPTLLRHDRSVADYLRDYQRISNRAVQDGTRGIRALSPFLLSVIADPRMQRSAWDHLAEKGGDAPGPNGHRCADYSSGEAWAACRTIGKAIRSGIYRPGEERIVHVGKLSGSGTRPLVLLDVEDRMVQRATMTVLQPLLDPLFNQLSYGFRPRRGHLLALAAAERIAMSERRMVWLTADIKDAFQRVPVARLMDVLRKLFPDDKLMAFLADLLPGQYLPGLRQGGALSPLMLSVYLDHFLDRKWHGDKSKPPLVRVADDILILCKSAAEAHAAYSDLKQLLVPAGMPLKHGAAESIHDLANGDSARWLGFVIRKAKRGYIYGLATAAWTRLRKQLELAHTKTDSPLRAITTVKAWLSQRGPAYRPAGNAKAVVNRVLDFARKQGFEEMPSMSQLLHHWQLAGARWQIERQRALQSMTENDADADDHGRANGPAC